MSIEDFEFLQAAAIHDFYNTELIYNSGLWQEILQAAAIQDFCKALFLHHLKPVARNFTCDRSQISFLRHREKYDMMGYHRKDPVKVLS